MEIELKQAEVQEWLKEAAKTDIATPDTATIIPADGGKFRAQVTLIVRRGQFESSRAVEKFDDARLREIIVTKFSEVYKSSAAGVRLEYSPSRGYGGGSNISIHVTI